MPFKCVVPLCNSNHEKSIYEGDGVFPVFEFPGKKKPDLHKRWIRFVNRSDWEPTDSSRICSKHFESKYIKHGTERVRLLRKLDPVPTIYPKEAEEKPSLLPTEPTKARKPPTVRVFQEDEISDYTEKFSIKSFADLLTKTCLDGYQVKRTENYIIYYRVEFREPSMCPQIMEAIKIDNELRVELQFKGNPVPLPSWFVKGRDGKVNNLTQIENFPSHIRDITNSGDGQVSIFEELEKRRFYKPQGRPPYSSAVIRYALLLRHTSAQAYRLLLEKFPLPSFSLLAKIQQGGVDAIKAIKLLLETWICSPSEMTDRHGGDGKREDMCVE